MPYLLRRLSKPSLPRHVCFALNISCKVPSGRDARVSGTIVTRVRSLVALLKEIPCLAFLWTTQPSRFSSLISCLPVRAGILVYLDSRQLRNTLDMRTNKNISIGWNMDRNVPCGSVSMKFDIMFFEEALSLANVLKSIQMQRHCFLQSFFRFRERASKSRCAQFFTTSNPSSTFSVI